MRDSEAVAAPPNPPRFINFCNFSFFFKNADQLRALTIWIRTEQAKMHKTQSHMESNPCIDHLRLLLNVNAWAWICSHGGRSMWVMPLSCWAPVIASNANEHVCNSKQCECSLVIAAQCKWANVAQCGWQLIAQPLTINCTTLHAMASHLLVPLTREDILEPISWKSNKIFKEWWYRKLSSIATIFQDFFLEMWFYNLILRRSFGLMIFFWVHVCANFQIWEMLRIGFWEIYLKKKANARSRRETVHVSRDGEVDGGAPYKANRWIRKYIQIHQSGNTFKRTNMKNTTKRRKTKCKT